MLRTRKVKADFLAALQTSRVPRVARSVFDREDLPQGRRKGGTGEGEKRNKHELGHEYTLKTRRTSSIPFSRTLESILRRSFSLFLSLSLSLFRPGPLPRRLPTKKVRANSS